jgi:hypothetical protein
LNISANTIYECKLNIKDFSEDQYKKYLLVLNKYKIIYLIDRDCIIDINNKVMYTLDTVKYKTYISKIPLMQKISQFDEVIVDFKIKEIKVIYDVL